MKSCPSREELYLYMDGECSRSMTQEFSLHVRDCDECRSALEGMSVVQGQLYSRPELLLPGDFERRFRERLLGRVATSTEARASRWPAVAGSLAAGVLVGVLLWLLAKDMGLATSETSSGDGGDYVAEWREERRRERLSKLRGDLLAMVRMDSGQREAQGSESLRSLDHGFRAVGHSISSEILKAIRGVEGPLDPGWLAVAGLHGDRLYAPSLRQWALTNATIDSDLRREAFRALGRIGSAESVRTLETAAKSESRRGDAFEALLSIEGETGWRALDRLLAEGAPQLRSEFVEIAAESEDPRVDQAFRRLYREGLQSERLLQELLDRPGTLEWAMGEIDAARPRRREGRLAVIRLLGRLRDDAATPLLVECLDRPAEEKTAMAALTEIGSDRAIFAVADRCLPESRRQTSAPLRRSHDRARAALSRSPAEAAKPLLERARRAEDPRARRSLLAAAYCGGAEVVEPLLDLVGRDDLEDVAIEALGEIEGDAARSALEVLGRSEDPSVRRRARRVLRKRRIGTIR